MRLKSRELKRTKGKECERRGADTEMKRKTVKRNARKLSDMQGRHAKEVKFKSRELTELNEKEMIERKGKRARWPAVSRQRVNPAGQAQGLPSVAADHELARSY